MVPYHAAPGKVAGLSPERGGKLPASSLPEGVPESPSAGKQQRFRHPLVSIVIPTHNGRHHLEKCLPALAALDYPKRRVEVLVVDNASTDGTATWLSGCYPTVKVLRQEQNNYCAANNAGIRKARGDYVALLNNDTEVDRGWLRELVLALESNPRAGAAGSKVLLASGRIHTTGHYEQPNHHWGDRGYEEEDKGQYDWAEDVPSLCGVAVLYRRRCLLDVGEQDERFVAYYEDVDYSLRCRKRGWTLRYVPTSVVHHFYHGTASRLEEGGMPFARYYTERNRLLLLAKHFPDKLPEALSTFSHFYVDKEYRVLYESLPVVLGVLAENAGDRLPSITEQLFANLRKVALYESEGIRTERILYQQKLRRFEEEWHRNMASELAGQHQRVQADFRLRLEGALAEAHSRKESEIATLRTLKDEELGRTHSEVSRLQGQVTRQERELGHLSYELARLREHPMNRISRRLGLLTTSSAGKGMLLEEQQIRMAAQEQEMSRVLSRVESLNHAHNELQSRYEEKIQHALEAERHVVASHAEALELRKRMDSWRQEITELLGAQRLLRRRLPPREPGGTWLPSVSKEMAAVHLLHAPLPKPRSVHISIVDRCFFRCSHCDIWKNKRRGELTREQLSSLWLRLSEWLGPAEIHIAGGEPFLRPDLLDVLSDAVGNGLRVTLTTNGWRINRRTAKRLGELGLRAINVSVDGQQEAHDAIRGVKGAHARAMRALRLLNSSKQQTNITQTTVVTSKSLEHLPAMVKECSESRFDGITFQALCSEFSRPFRWDWWRRTSLWPADAERVRSVMDHLIELKLQGYQVNNSVAHLEHMAHYFTTPTGSPGECSVGTRTLHLDEKGDVLLCWNMPPIGNSLDDDLRGLWGSTEAALRRHQIQRCARECFILNCNYM